MRSVLAEVTAGDQITWYYSRSCWYSYRVSAVLARSTATGAQAAPDCARDGGLVRIYDPPRKAAQRTSMASVTGWRHLVGGTLQASRSLERTASASCLGGIRSQGGHTYRLRAGQPTNVLIDVPVGMRLKYTGYSIAFTRFFHVCVCQLSQISRAAAFSA